MKTKKFCGACYRTKLLNKFKRLRKYKADKKHYTYFYDTICLKCIRRFQNDSFVYEKEKIRKEIRDALKSALNFQSIDKHIEKRMQCNVKQLREHFESKFTKGMTRKNYGGKNGWQSDHIKPLDLLELGTVEGMKKAYYYKNLQPLWKKDNSKKGAKYKQLKRKLYS